MAARAIVLDIAGGQLRAGKERRSRSVVWLRGDHPLGNTREFCGLPDWSFQPAYRIRACYIADVNEAFVGIDRVLRLEGVCRADSTNSARESLGGTDWTGAGNRIVIRRGQRKDVVRKV